MADSTSAAELSRLQDIIKVKDTELEKCSKEISALKTTLSVKEKALAKHQAESTMQSEKALQAQENSSAVQQELTALKADKKKLESQISELMKQHEKLKDKLANLEATKSPGMAQMMAALQGEIRQAKADANKMAEQAKGAENLVRAKDKELDRMQKKVDDTDTLMKRNLELENAVKETQKALEDARNENKTLQHVNRTREADIAKLTKDLEAADATLAATNVNLSNTSATLKAAQSRMSDLEQEVAVLRDDLARTAAVASRVAMSEVRSGYKGDGTVPVTQHLEEIKHLTGEISRLRDQISSLEKQLSVADELKDKFKQEADAAREGVLLSRRPVSASRTPPPAWNAGVGAPRPSSRPPSRGTTPTRPKTANDLDLSATTPPSLVRQQSAKAFPQSRPISASSAVKQSTPPSLLATPQAQALQDKSDSPDKTGSQAAFSPAKLVRSPDQAAPSPGARARRAPPSPARRSAPSMSPAKLRKSNSGTPTQSPVPKFTVPKSPRGADLLQSPSAKVAAAAAAAAAAVAEAVSDVVSDLMSDVRPSDVTPVAAKEEEKGAPAEGVVAPGSPECDIAVKAP
mmetsp:Transcript_28348/g.62289  ORF Transcript_28348/g.62289 Transcript_28348/m.62289 type:complete len:577 (+) Transcript_28348:161-1891(+)|eukprot:CAMPEP_0202894834 /NCGR_PEP_ID=MMETSP1392-20130828/4137_1 /ASSEMBLY_ACC=CAM_ASM_000868 /TAXON_ID=225041 /ORGANISM="Chlamydomonas chlamydogama, Strain SAG 11-48b" /LENGTH=576 /DNA_ID=CAMNT_0049579637 /DNA_START=154 /DNA_END=1884 /DNA_ORIENTATION=-